MYSAGDSPASLQMELPIDENFDKLASLLLFHDLKLLWLLEGPRVLPWQAFSHHLASVTVPLRALLHPVACVRVSQGTRDLLHNCFVGVYLFSYLITE